MEEKWNITNVHSSTKASAVSHSISPNPTKDFTNTTHVAH